MKKIQTIKIWYNGSFLDAVKMKLNATDNIENSATFNYSLYDINGTELSSGYLIMEGKDYIDWLQNQYAWDWVANKLNIVLLSDEELPKIEILENN